MPGNYLKKGQQADQQEEESVRDIKSEEMVVEDAQQPPAEGYNVGDIMGGEQEIEEGQEEGEMVELTEEQ